MNAPMNPRGPPAVQAVNGRLGSAEKDRRVAEKFAKFKSGIEGKKNKIEQELSNRNQRYEQIQNLANTIHPSEQHQLMERFKARENQLVQSQCKLWTPGDFRSVKVLGEGTFGVVHLVRRQGSQEFYALKQMKKSAYRRKNQRERAYQERNILVEKQSRWFVQLYATFQDGDDLFMLMEFLQGGDLIGLLIKKKRFNMKETQFYMAELLEALDTVHKQGFVHRDVKPDNIVLGSDGHIKLLDFGLCKQALTDSNADHLADLQEMPTLHEHSAVLPQTSRRAQLRSSVGTPQYMSPEVYKGEYTHKADLWSLGIIMHECLVGVVPFHAGMMQGFEGISIMRHKILQWNNFFPEILARGRQKGYINDEVASLMVNIICDEGRRYDAPQIRAHPFFRDLDFNNLHDLTPPFVPQITSPADTSCFDDFGERPLPQPTCPMKDTSLDWTDYDFDRRAHELQKPELDMDAITSNLVQFRRHGDRVVSPQNTRVSIPL